MTPAEMASSLHGALTQTNEAYGRLLQMLLAENAALRNKVVCLEKDVRDLDLRMRQADKISTNETPF